ncbi:MAG: amidohydrolase family protein [Candidatus Omnitrophica bacterium]|nr:amidohydrolase family protein [Candidatus Omnitrophota bacterium]MCM8802876.1 amidohydrolase family protein [Candidatus Omnitrophota bacterium]
MSNLKERFLKGEKLEIELYDIHAHIGKFNRDYPVFAGDIEEILKEMERINIKKAIVMPLGVYGAEWFYQNEKLINDCKKYSEKLIGFCLINLNFPEKVIEKEIEGCLKNGIKGIKLIAAYQNCQDLEKKTEFVCECAHNYKVPILNHSWQSPEFLEKMVRKYKNVHYICGHFSFVWKDIVNNYENVWLCTCNYLEFGVVERMVEEIRNDRICWGSDFSDLHFGFTLGPILLASIRDEIKIKILGENTKNFIKNVIKQE